MKAAVYHGRRAVRVEKVPDPGYPGDGELVLQVLRAGICGTDVHEYVHGPHQIPLTRRHPSSGHQGPVVLGHEILGRVLAAGSGAAFERGQRVVPGAGRWCGRCGWCRANLTNLCMSYYTFGLQADGGLAEMVTVPAEMCRPVRENCPDETAVLAQPLAVAVHAISQSSLSAGDSLAVIGAGGIGAFILVAARARGLGPVFAVDVSPGRLTTASRLGAEAVVDARTTDAATRLRGLTDGLGVDVAIEASGTEAGLTSALAGVRRGGRVLLVGLQSARRSLDLHRLVMDEIELKTSSAHVCDVDLPAALEMLTRLELASAVVDRVIALEDLVPAGLLPMAEGRVQGKVLVDPSRHA